MDAGSCGCLILTLGVALVLGAATWGIWAWLGQTAGLITLLGGAGVIALVIGMLVIAGS